MLLIPRSLFWDIRCIWSALKSFFSILVEFWIQFYKNFTEKMYKTNYFQSISYFFSSNVCPFSQKLGRLLGKKMLNFSRRLLLKYEFYFFLINVVVLEMWHKLICSCRKNIFLTYTRLNVISTKHYLYTFWGPNFRAVALCCHHWGTNRS